MARLFEARFYEARPDGSVVYTLCPHDCHIPEGGRGACAMRYNRGDRLYSLDYDRVIAHAVNPIEKKTLLPLPARLLGRLDLHRRMQPAPCPRNRSLG